MLTRIMRGSSADTLQEILDTMFEDAETALDMTYGNGKFWKPDTRMILTGIDLEPTKARDRVADFRSLPFSDGEFHVAIFDPPYQTDAGEDAFIGARFGSYESVEEMKAAVLAGVAEAARVSSKGYVVKVMDHIHGNRLLEMTQWVRMAAPHELYDFVLLESPSKSENKRWTKNGGPMSVRSNATTWLIFRHDGPKHKRHRKAPSRVAQEHSGRFRRLRPKTDPMIPPLSSYDVTLDIVELRAGVPLQP